MLDTSFRYADITKKPRPPKKRTPRDGDGDGFVNDGKPNQRPVAHGIPGIPPKPFTEGPEQNRWWQDDAKRKAYLDWKAQQKPKDAPAPKKTPKYESGELVSPSEVNFTYGPNKTKDFNVGEVAWAWVPFNQDRTKGKHRPVLVVGTIGDQVVVLQMGSQPPTSNKVMALSLPLRNEQKKGYTRYDQLVVLDRSAFKKKMDVFDIDRFDKYVDRALKKHKEIDKEEPMLDDTFKYATLVKARKVRDADGDGRVYDGTPRERPALPSEKVPGKAPRAPKGGPKKKPVIRDVGGTDPAKQTSYVVVGRKGNKKVEFPAKDREEAIQRGLSLANQGYDDVQAIPQKKPLEFKKPDADPAPEGGGDGPPSTSTKPAPKKPKKKGPSKPPKKYDIDEDEFFGETLAELESDTDEEMARNWFRAMIAAANGDEEGYDAAMADFFKLETDQEMGEAIMDAVDGLFDEQFGEGSTTPILDDAVGNIEGWDKMPSKLRTNQDPILERSAEDIGTGELDQIEDARNTKQLLGEIGDLTKNPAYKHLQDGGSIEDAPQEGLMDAVRAMPERFDMLVNGDSGVSPNWWVIDKTIDTNNEVYLPFAEAVLDENGLVQRRASGKLVTKSSSRETTNQVWVFKGPGEVGERGFGIKEDVLNEQMGAFVQEAMGMKAPQTKWATRADAKVPIMAQAHYAQNVGEGDAVAGADRVFDFDPYGAQGRKGKKGRQAVDQGLAAVKDDQTFLDLMERPEDMLEMPFFDFLIGNVIDRHHRNWLVNVDKDKKTGIAVIDNGYAFEGARSRVGDKQDINTFAATSPYNQINLHLGVLALGEDEERIVSFIQDFAERAGKLDLKKMRKKLADGKLSSIQQNIVEQNIAAMEERIQYLQANAEKIAKELLR